MSAPAPTPIADDRTSLRWMIYSILIVVSVGSMVGRILAVNSVDRIGSERAVVSREVAAERKKLTATGLSEAEIETQLETFQKQILAEKGQQRPFLSANDRSRWGTIRALVELGTYEIDEIIQQNNWDTIDMVQHSVEGGERRLFSSKPPLLATILAGQYWVIHKVTGFTLGTHPYEIGRFMLITINVLPLTLYFWLLARFAERFGRTDWGRIFMMATACFATFLSTFAVTLNNHIPAAVSIAVALHCGWRIWFDGERHWKYFAIAGFFAAFAATNDLPALSFAGLLWLGLLWLDPRKTMAAYVPAALVVAAAFFITVYAAHGEVKLPYATFGKAETDENWYDYEYERNGRVIESYWRNPVGIDKGEPSRGMYAVHALVGHHGIFSLSPVWILSFLGILVYAVRSKTEFRSLALFVLILSVVCFVFYVMRPQDQRNYGGMTSGLRWVFWLIPLWLAMLVPVADYVSQRKWLRRISLVLLGLSVMSVAYPTWNPWTHPWFTNLMLHYEWLKL